MKIVIDKRKINTIIIVFLVLLFFSVYYSGTKKNGNLYYILFPICLFAVFFENKYSPIFSFLKNNTLFFFLFCSVCVITTLIYYKNDSYIQRMGQVSFVIISILLGYYCFWFGQLQYVDVCFKWINFLILISSIFAFIEYFFSFYFEKPFFYSNYRSTGRLGSIFSNPITFASLLLYGIFYVILYKKNFLMKFILLMLYFFCLYRTLSRSGWVACVITLFMMFLCSHKVNLKKIILFLFLFIGIILFFYSDIGKDAFITISNRIRETEDSVSLNQRIGTMIYFIDKVFKDSVFWEILFGHGERASKDVMLSIKIVTANFGTTDNSYIQILYNYGIVMLAGFIFCIMKSVKNIFLLDKSETQLEWMLLPQCISAFFFEIMENHIVGFIFLFMFGAWLCKESWRKNVNENKGEIN